MKNRGFTLVELLAVLVIISALALITIPSILNYVNKHKGEISEVTEKLIYTGIEQYIEDNSDTYKQYAFNQYCITLQEIVDANYLSSPIIDTESGYEIDLNQTIQVNYDYKENSKYLEFQYQLNNSCNEEVKTSSCYVLDGDGTNVGDEIACGNEEFYVISRTSTETTMLAKYNLNVGTYKYEGPEGIQNINLMIDRDDGSVYGTVPFSDSKYWTSSGYVFDEDQTGINKYVKDYELYLKNNIVSGAEARLISFEELILLGCSEEDWYCDVSGYPWLYSTNYWLGTVESGNYIFGLLQSSAIKYLNYQDSLNYGVRPVVKIPNSKIDYEP